MTAFSRMGDVVSWFLSPLNQEFNEGRWESFIRRWEDHAAPFDISNPQTARISANIDILLSFLTKEERARADVLKKGASVILLWGARRQNAHTKILEKSPRLSGNDSSH
jgi:hypothetical protein